MSISKQRLSTRVSMPPVDHPGDTPPLPGKREVNAPKLVAFKWCSPCHKTPLFNDTKLLLGRVLLLFSVPEADRCALPLFVVFFSARERAGCLLLFSAPFSLDNAAVFL